MNGEPGHRAADYGGRAVEAARRVMAELSEILDRFGDVAVLVGGWVPELAFPESEPRHVGSLDVDFLLDPERLPPAEANRLAEILKARGYLRTEPPFKFVKMVHVDDGEPLPVEVDLLMPAGVSPFRFGRGVRALRPAPAAGGALALQSRRRATVEARSTTGDAAHTEVRIPEVGSWLVMKAHALGSREKEKDAYDIALTLRGLADGPSAIAKELGPHLSEPEVRKALEILRSSFRSPDDFGPQAFSRFMDPADPDERLFLARDAYERVQAVLRALASGGEGVE
jgi:hypothetical protein